MTQGPTGRGHRDRVGQESRLPFRTAYSAQKDR
jgi:hypothetical protein